MKESKVIWKGKRLDLYSKEDLVQIAEDMYGRLVDYYDVAAIKQRAAQKVEMLKGK